MSNMTTLEGNIMLLKEMVRRRQLLVVGPLLGTVDVSIPYEGITFTVAKVTITLGSENKTKTMVGEGIARKSFDDPYWRPQTARNLATERALEALDKKLRRRSGYVGHRYEG